MAVVSIAATVVGIGLAGPLLAVVAIAWLITYTLRRAGAHPPDPPRLELSAAGLRALGAYLGQLLAWAAPIVPFVAPAVTFVAVTWPLPADAESIRFQEQASQIIPLLLIGFVIETGALRWRRQPVDWLLSLVTVVILIVGEVYAMVALATDDPSHADVVAGAMAAGAVAILTAAVQGSLLRGEEGRERA